MVQLYDQYANQMVYEIGTCPELFLIFALLFWNQILIWRQVHQIFMPQLEPKI